MRATFTRPHGVRHLMADYDLSTDRLYGHVVKKRGRTQFTALRYFTLDGTDHGTHEEQARMIRRYIAWRNRHARDEALREIVNRANVA